MRTKREARVTTTTRVACLLPESLMVAETLEGVYIGVARGKEAPAEKYGVRSLDDTNSTLNRIGPDQQQPAD